MPQPRWTLVDLGVIALCLMTGAELWALHGGRDGLVIGSMLIMVYGIGRTR